MLIIGLRELVLTVSATLKYDWKRTRKHENFNAKI